MRQQIKKRIRRSILKLIESFGYSKSYVDKIKSHTVELDDSDIDLIKYVLDKRYTQTSIPRLINTLKSCRYVVDNNITGDFVECGVWRGGNGILAKLLFEQLDSDRAIWMFDTFEGMTAPTEFDIESSTKILAAKKYEENQRGSYSDWCFASLKEVKNNFINAELKLDGSNFVKGNVCETLMKSENIPSAISVLRLDTDWYESTKIELEILFPILSKYGVLIIDDYGHWEGARKAVDEYFEKQSYKPLLNVIDYTGRSVIKICEV